MSLYNWNNVFFHFGFIFTSFLLSEKFKMALWNEDCMLILEHIQSMRNILVCCVFQQVISYFAHCLLVDMNFSGIFTFNIFLISGEKSMKKIWNEQKRLKMANKMFQPAFGSAQHPKAGWNTQHIHNFCSLVKIHNMHPRMC